MLTQPLFSLTELNQMKKELQTAGKTAGLGHFLLSLWKSCNKVYHSFQEFEQRLASVEETSYISTQKQNRLAVLYERSCQVSHINSVQDLLTVLELTVQDLFQYEKCQILQVKPEDDQIDEEDVGDGEEEPRLCVNILSVTGKEDELKVQPILEPSVVTQAKQAAEKGKIA
jgi:hypothetical protein